MGRSAASHRRFRALKRLTVCKAKDRPCADCGQRFPTVAMDFDHVRGRKDYDISKMRNNNSSLEALHREIAKCDVVCACCHRIRTQARLDGSLR